MRRQPHGRFFVQLSNLLIYSNEDDVIAPKKLIRSDVGQLKKIEL